MKSLFLSLFALASVGCMAIPVFQKDLTLIMKFPPFRVHFLGTNQTLTVN